MKALLIDGFNLIRRIYEAGKTGGKGSGVDGVHSEVDMARVISTSVVSVKRALSKHNPTHACCIMDSHDKTWRHLLYADYKANRQDTPADLLENLPSFEGAFAELGLKSLRVESYEADDVIATLAKGISAGGGKSLILSTDKSFLQLLSENTKVFDHFNDRELDAEYVREKFGVYVQQLLDFWALAGDRSTNIKGVDSIGAKTACKLLEEFSGLEAILESESIEKSVMRIKKDVAVVKRCKLLVTLNGNVDLGTNLKQFRFNPSP